MYIVAYCIQLSSFYNLQIIVKHTIYAQHQHNYVGKTALTHKGLNNIASLSLDLFEIAIINHCVINGLVSIIGSLSQITPWIIINLNTR